MFSYIVGFLNHPLNQMAFKDAISFSQSDDKHILSNDSFGTFIQGHLLFCREYLVTMSLIFLGKKTFSLKIYKTSFRLSHPLLQALGGDCNLITKLDLYFWINFQFSVNQTSNTFACCLKKRGESPQS